MQSKIKGKMVHRSLYLDIFSKRKTKVKPLSICLREIFPPRLKNYTVIGTDNKNFVVLYKCEYNSISQSNIGKSLYHICFFNWWYLNFRVCQYLHKMENSGCIHFKKNFTGLQKQWPAGKQSVDIMPAIAYNLRDWARTDTL